MHKRLDHIDGLRGLAAALVLYQHLAEYGGALAPDGHWVEAQLHFLLTYVDLGKVGVVAFFAVSGYIVPFSFGSLRPRLGFLISRFFRLYPAYWLSLVLAVLLLPNIGQHVFSGVQVAANVTMVQYFLRQADVLGVYWTLLVELIFYAMCFGVFCLGRLRSAVTALWIFSAMLAMALVGAIAKSRGIGVIPASLPLYLAVMWYGACLRLATLEQDTAARRMCRIMLPILVVMIPLVWATAYDDTSHKESVLSVIVAFYLALLMFLYCVHFRGFVWSPLVYLGGISYSLYLFHPLALELALHWAKGYAWPMAGVVQLVMTVVLSVLAAHVVQRWVEVPAIRLGKRLVAKLSAAAAGSASPSRI
jgi:peptidoglycan/LPS O-acetylase OafA/YrhL